MRPSYGGRRVATRKLRFLPAAHLVDRVLPQVPVRQWVVFMPFALRHRLAYDAGLASDVLGLFVRAVFTSLRRRARSRWGVRRGQCGAVTFVQRFGSALSLNVHFHSLVLDGLYEDHSDGIRFFPLPAPEDAEVERVAHQLARRLLRLLECRGLGPDVDASEADPLRAEQPLLAALYAASVAGRVATGPRAGRGVLRRGDRIDADDLSPIEGERCASVGGVSLHANVAVPARDRRRVEGLCCYVARPPLATERLSRMDDGRLLYRLKQRWRDGTTHIVLEPLELLEKLAALVPPPRFHLVRYHGILGPCASARDRVVPALGPGATEDRPDACPSRARPPRRAGGRSAVYETDSANRRDGTFPVERPRASSRAPEQPPPPRGEEPSASRPPRLRYLSWAELMRRVFAIDVLECPRCGGPMRILAAIHPPKATPAILECLELSSRAPPVAPAIPEDDEALTRGPGQPYLGV